MNKIRWVIVTVLLLLSTTVFANKVVVLTIDGTIGPATQDYIVRGIDQAKEEKAEAIILKLNTQDGLKSSTLEINKAIKASAIPVIAYITPKGGRAGSAGTLILMGSHYSVMSNGTNIGSTSSDVISSMKNLAESHKRHIDWENKIDNQSTVFSEKEAKKLSVIDDISNDIESLVKKVDGKIINVNGDTKTLSTKNATIITVPTDWHYDLLTFLTNPNIAYIMMMLAIYGLFFEFANPRFFIPGIVGGLTAILIFYALQLMPINYAGMLLMILGVGLVALEMYLTGSGIIGVCGIVAFVVGSVMLFDSDDSHYQLARTLIFMMSTITAIFFMIILSMTSHPKRKNSKKTV